MSAMSDLRSTIRSEISSLVAISCFRPAMRSERAGVVAVGCSTSVSILFKVVSSAAEELALWDVIIVFIWSTAEVIRVRNVANSFLMVIISAAYSAMAVEATDGAGGEEVITAVAGASFELSES